MPSPQFPPRLQTLPPPTSPLASRSKPTVGMCMRQLASGDPGFVLPADVRDPALYAAGWHIAGAISLPHPQNRRRTIARLARRHIVRHLLCRSALQRRRARRLAAGSAWPDGEADGRRREGLARRGICVGNATARVSGWYQMRSTRSDQVKEFPPSNSPRPDAPVAVAAANIPANSPAPGHVQMPT